MNALTPCGHSTFFLYIYILQFPKLDILGPYHGNPFVAAAITNTTTTTNTAATALSCLNENSWLAFVIAYRRGKIILSFFFFQGSKGSFLCFVEEFCVHVEDFWLSSI